jgi:hypothetical protein
MDSSSTTSALSSRSAVIDGEPLGSVPGFSAIGTDAGSHSLATTEKLSFAYLRRNHSACYAVLQPVIRPKQESKVLNPRRRP